MFIFLGFICGILFGWLQYRLLSWILKRQGWVRLPLILLKLVAWAGIMVLLAIWSIPVLLLFVAGSTVSMIGSVIRVYQRAKEVS